ncbi:transglycosylase SLT domain-containing protein [Thermomonas haemolytica]|uniref:Membrane-bound lytic murein transglycosylase D n=1 Tax=Thermomonas haemolytica TaxID=141949 RepID=A0A4R3MW38_9GAMM|nr:transglycosylase SLT domain-containing protein [Thermomonas haemolytica]TCT20435.1 membrane-bound lytic murein transglycosylase D [Thermomonas haemolytica]
MHLRFVAAVLLPLLVALSLPVHADEARRERGNGAAAESRRDQAAVAALQQRMSEAEQRYRDAMQAEDEDAAAKATTAALAEMKAVVEACGKQRGCQVEQMLATYERLLQDTPRFDDAATDDGGDPLDERDFTAADVPDSASAAALLSEEGQRFVKMVQFNPAVQAGIRRWLTDLRPQLMDSYENYRYMQHLMSPAFRRYGLPEALLFGILAKESNGKVHAGSRAGAVGPLQFMPATGRRFGLGDDGSGFDTRYDPRAAADAAAQYLQERLAELGNSIELALAGYNGGEGRALRVYQTTGGRSFWDIDVYSQFPAETKDYVPMVIAAAWLYLHPKEYGIHWPKVSVRPTTITLTQPASLYELTICLGNWGSRNGYLRPLRNLNPRWSPDVMLPAGTVLNVTTRIAWLYRFNCTHGKRLELAQQLVASNVQSALVRVGEPTPANGPSAGEATPAPAPVERKPARVRTYQVKRGDTLHGIARKLQCDLDDLAKANKLKKPKYAIKPGQTLKLEGCDA